MSFHRSTGRAATTVGGFGVPAFAILPPLQQFGIITEMTIVYAFLESVLMLSSLLVMWAKYLGPDVSFDASRTGSTATAAGRNARPRASNRDSGQGAPSRPDH